MREESIFPVLEAGASAVLDKSRGYRDLIAAIKAVADGKTYLPPAMSSKVIGNVGN